jgi:hypothetical protein
MQSILNLLATISANPFIDQSTRSYASLLHNRLSGGSLGSIFGGF